MSLVGDMTRQDAGSLGVTLFVHGTVVSGYIVSGGQFLEAMASSVDEAVRRDTGKEPNRGGLADVFRDHSSKVYGPDADLENAVTTYIHLRDAQIFHPGANPIPTPGAWWRGRLASVDGWIFGTMGVSGA